MSDLALAPSPPTTADVVRLAQVGRVIQLMIDQGLTQAEACRQVGIEQRTFQRHVAHSDILQELRQETEGAITSAVSIALRGYVEGLENLLTLVRSPLTPASTVLKITKEFGDILKSFVAVVHTSRDKPEMPDEPEAVAPKPADTNFTIEGPVTIKITQQDGVPTLGPVIEGTSSPLD